MAGLIRLLLTVLLLAPAFVSGAEGRQFPDPHSGLREGTPDDPRFDCGEPDDEDDVDCNGLDGEQFNLFGFAPHATSDTAIYKEGARTGEPQVSGVAADAAWKVSTGDPRVVVAIVDTGIRWDKAELRKKIWLNRGELPKPKGASVYDADGDGAFTVDDYAADGIPDANGNGILDAQDLIRKFEDGSDDDNNGYVDDIAGWDFMDNDNDPDDSSSYSSARNHGTGRAEEAARATNDGEGRAGVCPACRLMMLRSYDTFVTPGDNYALSTLYAADNGALSIVIANGVLQNNRLAKAATTYAFDKGMALMHVSSDLNTANHNYPTNYVESVFINGCVADIPAGGSNEITGSAGFNLSQFGVELDSPIQTWFRQANLTQHGAHAHVCFVGDTGSMATGQAGGGAGLIHSAGIEKFGWDDKLSSNEVKQVLTLSAEDVLPFNTIGAGLPDRAQIGWDEHFGYGRADLGAALRMVSEGRVPPEALIQDPPWWHFLDPVKTREVQIRGMARARRASTCTYSLEYALGVEPDDEDGWTSVVEGKNCPQDDLLGGLPIDQIATQLPGSTSGKAPEDPNEFVITVRMRVTDESGNRGEDRKTYFVYHDPTWHTGWPKFVDTGGESSPVLYDIDGAPDGFLEIIEGNSSGELWVWNHDGTPHTKFSGDGMWKLPPGSLHQPNSPALRSPGMPAPNSGLRTPTVADLDADGVPEIIAPAADGRIFILAPDGSEKFTTAVGRPAVDLDASLSGPGDRDADNHPKKGLLGTVIAADLDGTSVLDAEGRPVMDAAGHLVKVHRELITGALDGRIYVWELDELSTGLRPRDGFPVLLSASGNITEIIATPAVGDLDGDGDLEIVSMTNEILDPVEALLPASEEQFAGRGAQMQKGQLPTGSSGEASVRNHFRGLAMNMLANVMGGSVPVYAIHGASDAAAKAGDPLGEGWPARINALLPDVLPLVGPGHALALADVDRDGTLEVVASATTGDVHVIEPDGRSRIFESVGVVNGSDVPEATKVLNLFEYVAVGDLNGIGGLDIAKGGLTAAGAVNLLVTGQNVPFNHVVQVWDGMLPEMHMPGFPVATDDYQLLSTPVIADIDSGSAGRELIVGNGLYLIHAYDNLGFDVDGFPKLTGGWNYAVPAIGDIDNDGKLEMVAGTREGWRFVWDLDRGPATAEANNEWWTEGHDQCHTNNYHSDCQPPSAPTDLELLPASGADRARVRFTLTGDDWLIRGRPSLYHVRAPQQRRSTDPAPSYDKIECERSTTANQRVQAICTFPDYTTEFSVTFYDEAGNRSVPMTVPIERSVSMPR